MSVKARVDRLEKAAGMGRPCIDCKRRLIRYSDLIRRTPRESVLVLNCDACGFPRHVILYGHTEREKELIIEMSAPRGRTLEARRRRFAVEVYLAMTPRQREIEAAGDAEENRLRSVTPRTDSVRSQLKALDEYAGVLAERQAARRLLLSEDQDEARVSRRAVYREVMAVVEEARAQAQAANDEELYRLLMMTKLEAFIFGATLPETLEKIEAHERGVRDAAERAEREKVERERERAEREERYRLEREERERVRVARVSGSQPYEPEPVRTPDQERVEPRPRFRIDPTAPVPRNPMVIDPTAAHVPEPARMVTFPESSHPNAVQFQRSTPEELPDHQKYYRGEYYDGDPRY